jgi:hypothetical protein
MRRRFCAPVRIFPRAGKALAIGFGLRPSRIMAPPMTRFAPSNNSPAALIAAALLFALLAFACLGFFTRYMADDFCQAEKVRKVGFLQTQVRWYGNWTGRFASSFSIAAAASVGPRAAAFLPALLLALWLAGAVWAVWQLALPAGWTSPLLHSLLLAGLVVFATVNGAHDIAQSFYWQAGLLTHVAPLVLLTCTLGAALSAARRRLEGKRFWPSALASALLAFAAGGFSESHTLMQTCGFALAAAACYRHRRSSRWAGAALPLTMTMLAGSLLALCVVALAPGNDVRQGRFPAPQGFAGTAGLTLFYSAAFVPYTAYLSPLNTLLAAALPAWAGARLAGAGRGVTLSPAELMRRLALAAAGGFTLIVASVLPAAYGMSQNLPARGRVIPQFVFVCVTAYCGYVAGAAYRGRPGASEGRSRNLPAWVSAAAVCLLSLAPALAILRVGRLLPLAAESAAAWDRMDREARAAGDRGETDLVVDALDDVEARFGGTAGALKLERDPNHWKNRCQASYYGVRTIRAR